MCVCMCAYIYVCVFVFLFEFVCVCVCAGASRYRLLHLLVVLVRHGAANVVVLVMTQWASVVFVRDVLRRRARSGVRYVWPRRWWWYVWF